MGMIPCHTPDISLWLPETSQKRCGDCEKRLHVTMAALSSIASVLLQENVSLTHINLHNKRVLHRVDLNLPLTPDGGVADATRLDNILPTLELLLSKGACVILCSHLGRPDPSSHTHERMLQEFSLAPIAKLLQQHLKQPGIYTGLVPDCVGPVAAEAVAALKPGQVCVSDVHDADAHTHYETAARGISGQQHMGCYLLVYSVCACCLQLATLHLCSVGFVFVT
jgi:hypothetical protein